MMNVFPIWISRSMLIRNVSAFRAVPSFQAAARKVFADHNWIERGVWEIGSHLIQIILTPIEAAMKNFDAAREEVQPMNLTNTKRCLEVG
jgi:hypothetical protein